MIRVHALTPFVLAPLVERAGAPPYRITQVLDWVYRRGATDPAAMTTLPRELRAVLANDLAGPSLETAAISRSSDGTRKLALRCADGELIESVLIPDRHRLTLCVSSQVGCAMGCGFCATARLGLRRQLRVDEIVGQVMHARAELARESLGVGHLTNVVFMGMGEPLHNLAELLPALEILSASWGLAISPRRITVSTVGLVPEMEKLLERTHVNLAVSLTATTEESRRRLMPVTRKYGLGRLLDACRALPLPRRRRITFEYVLLAGQNDADEDARRLVALLHGIRAKVNLICFNAFPGAPFAASPRERVARFQRLLLDSGVNATIRESRGPDIAAACGQLAAQAARGEAGGDPGRGAALAAAREDDAASPRGPDAPTVTPPTA
ncbi:MAG TPA: 23S rRNA (adenine(2503)-C(2))-methyltransferase RlmN [Candidatus Binatia bacterium]|nr:23S rRNA (adenine(2503)-C(2))-methyltransferase RlmN [Candidatus Binatia bacterium]